MPEPTDLLTVESHAGLVGDAVGGEAELLQLRQELRHLHRVPVLVVDLSIQTSIICCICYIHHQTYFK